ncbi:unnamed protein product, partial [Mesorhabditis spiculigera]
MVRWSFEYYLDDYRTSGDQSDPTKGVDREDERRWRHQEEWMTLGYLFFMIITKLPVIYVYYQFLRDRQIVQDRGNRVEKMPVQMLN